MKIMLDPGHGGIYTGAIGSAGIPEKDIVLAMCLQMAGHFNVAAPDHEIRVTRNGDIQLSRASLSADLQARCAVANSWPADLFVSIHCNAADAASANGFEVWTNPETDFADVVASEMWYRYRQTFPEMRGRLDLSDGDPDKESRFWVLVHTQMPAILFELGFISNMNDQSRLLQPAWQAKASECLVAAITEAVRWR